MEKKYSRGGKEYEYVIYNDIGEPQRWARGEIHDGKRKVIESKNLLSDEQLHRLRERTAARLIARYPERKERILALLKGANERFEREKSRSAGP